MTNTVVLSESTNYVVVLGTESNAIVQPVLSSASVVNIPTNKTVWSVDVGTGKLVGRDLPVYNSDEEAKLDGLTLGDYYFTPYGDIKYIRGRITNFLFNLSNRFTYIGKF